jgi:hypothetical protein
MNFFTDPGPVSLEPAAHAARRAAVAENNKPLIPVFKPLRFLPL